MNNLRVKKNQTISFGGPVVAHCIDTDNGQLFALGRQLEVLRAPLSNPDSRERLAIDFSNTTQVKSLECLEDVRLFEFVVETNGLLLVLRQGSIVHVTLSEPSGHHIKCSRIHPKPVTCAKLSPNQDRLALADDGGNIFLLSTLDGSQLYASNAITNNESLHKPVGVGWGSKETQFFGLDGRPSKEKQRDEQINLSEEQIAFVKRIESDEIFAETLRKQDTRSTVVDWRADGQLLATLSHIPGTQKHHLKVWNRCLELQYMSEQLVDIERGLMAWVSNGKYICCAQRRENGLNDIIMFERNGLVHLRLTLPAITVPNLYIRHLAWSDDSNVLSVLSDVYEAEPELKRRKILLLYTMQNYQFYLKRSLKLDSHDYKLRWDSVHQNRLHLLDCTLGINRELICDQVVDYCNKDDMVVVVDANKLHITPFALCNIPPPMSAIQLTLASLINSIKLTDDGDIHIFTADGFLVRTGPEFEQLSIDELPSWVQIHVSDQVTKKCSKVLHRLLKIEKSGPMPDGFSLTHQLPPGVANQSWFSGYETNLTDSRCCLMGEKEVVVSLTQDMVLRLDSTILSRACTSFRLTKRYLIFTTTDNLLTFVLLEGYESRFGTYSLPIETGATLLIAPEDDYKVVLQMPRGNLETIHPRVLILAKLVELLDERDVVTAIRIARRHRVNTNFLVDYVLRKCHFEDENYLEAFVRMAIDLSDADPSLLLLLLTELEDADIIRGRYASICPSLPSKSQEWWHHELDKNIHKTSDFCTVVIESIDFDERTLQPYLMCFLKREPKETPSALKSIHSKLPPELRVKALKFLLYFVDIDQLFMDALSTYETAIALSVANVSNKDPKEYLALLNSLDIIENRDLRAFKIDMLVKNYEKALSHLISYYKETQAKDRSEIFQKLIDLVVDKRLFRYALFLSYVEEELRDFSEVIWRKYGEYLLEKRCYPEAATAFVKAYDLSNADERNLESAIKCLSLSNEWQRLAALIVRCYSGDKRTTRMKHLVEQLLKEGKCYEAIVLKLGPRLELTLDDPVFQGLFERDEFFICEFSVPSSRSEISQVIYDRAHKLWSTLHSNFITAQDQFLRLDELLLEHHKSRELELPRLMNGGSDCDSLSTSDDSELSSNSSEGGVNRSGGASSIKTRKSNSKSRSKSRPKTKKLNLKRGSRYEDYALVVELKKFIAGQKMDHQDAMSMASALYEYGTDLRHTKKEVDELNCVVEESFRFVSFVVGEFWPEDARSESVNHRSLYRRFGVCKTNIDEPPENIDFEVLIRPQLPSVVTTFQL